MQRFATSLHYFVGGDIMSDNHRENSNASIPPAAESVSLKQLLDTGIGVSELIHISNSISVVPESQLGLLRDLLTIIYRVRTCCVEYEVHSVVHSVTTKPGQLPSDTYEASVKVRSKTGNNCPKEPKEGSESLIRINAIDLTQWTAASITDGARIETCTYIYDDDTQLTTVRLFRTK